jgi:hypothetical protein
MHVDEAQLQRLVDDELDGLADPTDEWVRDHVGHCEPCRERVARANSDQQEIFAKLANLDHLHPSIDYMAVMARGDALRSSWIAKAAGFLVVAALAGAAYAAPGSPLPSLAARIFGTRPAVRHPPIEQKTVPTIPAVSGVTVAAGNRMVILFRAIQPDRTVRVTLSDSPEIEVRASGSGASFTAGEDVLTIDNSNSRADFAISIPRNAPQVEVRIGNARVFYKEGAGIVTDYPVDAGTYVIPLGSRR